MKIAVEGCAHGELDKIYESIELLEKENNIKVDLLIICGDFQSVRNPSDLECMAVPPKYREMNTFYKYYSGEKKAPILTVFVGGNHEASNYLSELTYGGWVCPNIYYMGYANVVNVGGIRIAGLSGIFKGRDYMKGHFERPPYDESSKKSVYHVRNVDVFRLKQIKTPIDICISHDWPRGVYHHGNKNDLLRWKPFFKQEMESNTLGSEAAEELLKKLKPTYWFAAHLHCKFTAIVPHDDPDKPTTRFLALDKCLPRRNFLQLLDIDERNDSLDLRYDPEWLCILQSTNHLINTSKRNSYMPGIGSSERWDFSPSPEEIQQVQDLFDEGLKVPDNFVVTAPTYDPVEHTPRQFTVKAYINPQTEVFCKTLNITDPFKAIVSSDCVSVSDFSYGESDASSSKVSLSLNKTDFSDDNSSDSNSKDESDFTSSHDLNKNDSELFTLDREGSLESSDIFFIDRVGSNKACNVENNIQNFESDNFCIDKSSCNPNDFSIANSSMVAEFGSANSSLEKSFLQLDTSCSKGSGINQTPSKENCNQTSPLKIQDCVSNTTTFLQQTQSNVPADEPLESFPEINLCKISSNEQIDTPTPPTKKFKRRNLALYQSQCDISL